MGAACRPLRCRCRCCLSLPQANARGNQARADQNGNLGRALRQWRGPGGPDVSLFRGVQWEPPIGEAAISLFCLYFCRTLSLLMAAMTWERMFRATSLLCSTPKENRLGRRLFRSEWIPSPGMLEAPSHPRGGPGLGWEYCISPGLQGI